MQFDPVAFKTQLRWASQGFGQAQAKSDSRASITRRDIATLIQQDNLPLAREKAERLIQDEAFADLLGELEMQIGLLVEHLPELEGSLPTTPVFVEAAATLIFATPHTHSKDLDVIRNQLISTLGWDFANSAMENREQHVSRRVLQNVSKEIPSASKLDIYLRNIAVSHGLDWSPGVPRQDLVNPLSEFLDQGTAPSVDIASLRKLCSRGLPDEPNWLRPKIWKLLLGTLPLAKAQWNPESTKQRDAYYDLVRRLLVPFTNLHSPQLDKALLDVYRQLASVPRHLFVTLEGEPESFSQCPLNGNADETAIPVAQALDSRLEFLQRDGQEVHPSHPSTPEIRLETEVLSTPGISLSNFDANDSRTSTTLLSSRKCNFGNAHPGHCSALLRLLYLHSTVNPGNLSPHIPSLLVPLYSVLMQEVDPENSAHVEADTFWLFEALVAEISGLEDDSGNTWMGKLAERLKWVDYDLFLDLQTKGLDPGLPHYSYRWMMPLLTHTLPLSSVIIVWDAIFSCGPRTRESTPKLEYLVNACTSMLTHAKRHILRIGRSQVRSLWGDELGGGLPHSSTPGPSDQAFLEGLSILQKYHIDGVGGVDRILQTASDLARRESLDKTNERPESLSLRARLTTSMWKGINRAMSTAEISIEDDESSDSDGNTTESTPPQSQPSLTSKLGDTVWKGITNRSAMEAPPTPTIPVCEPPSSPETPRDPERTSLWGYAEKLKDSDVVATLSKVSSNWRAKAILGSWNKGSLNEPEPLHSPLSISREKVQLETPNIYSRPPGTQPLAYHSQNAPDEGNPSLIDKTRSLLSINRSPPASDSKLIQKAPRPLLLGSAPILSSSRGDRDSPSCSSSRDSTPDNEEWAEVMRAKRQHFHRDSYSSASSLSPSDALSRLPKSSRSDCDSDPSSSRVVSLNRRSISPMAPNFRPAYARSSSQNSPVSSWLPTSPALARSPIQGGRTRNTTAFKQSQGSDASTNVPPLLMRKPVSSLVDPSTESEGTTSTPSIGVPIRTARVRSRRNHRPANLQIDDNSQLHIDIDSKPQSLSSLAVEWPKDEADITTPKATSFEGEGHNIPSRSPKQTRKVSTGDVERTRKPSTDSMHNDRHRKISNGPRARKISTEGRDMSRARRESAAEEGDDEGYDDLLSAYESEDSRSNLSSR